MLIHSKKARHISEDTPEWKLGYEVVSKNMNFMLGRVGDIAGWIYRRCTAYLQWNDQSAAASFERRRSSTSTSGDASNYRSFGSLINNTLASLAAYLLLGHVEKFGVGVVTERHACLAGLRAPARPPPACRAYPLRSLPLQSQLTVS